MDEIDEMCIENLRREGYAVVIFSPTELGDQDASQLEDVLRVRGDAFLNEPLPIGSHLNTDMDNNYG